MSSEVNVSFALHMTEELNAREMRKNSKNKYGKFYDLVEQVLFLTDIMRSPLEIMPVDMLDCSTRGGGMWPAAQVTMIPLKGAASGHPQ